MKKTIKRSKKLWKKVLLVALASATLITPSCKKPKIEKSVPDTNIIKTMSYASGNNDYVFGPDNATTGYRYTKLGRQYGKMFNVNNVINAWNALSANKISNLTPSHLYIKFTPRNLEELKSITDAKIPVYTFPLDFEIIEAGDYMRDPATEPNAIPALYTCIPYDLAIPNTEHQILDELFLLDIRSVVAEKAFELAGEKEIYPGLEEGEDCPMQLRSASNTVLEHYNRNLDWGSYDFAPNETLPYIIPRQPNDNINTPPSTVTNACNCSNNTDDRKPSGCIKVEETQWFNGNVVFEGVNDIVADFIGPFFQRLSPFTNANGCYKDSRIMRYKIWHPIEGTIRLPVIMSAIFISDKKTIKGLNHNGNSFEYAFPMTHCIWSVQGGGLNNVNITYLRDWNTDHNETKYYTCVLL
jgi:hypothetical protein